jgi:carotenoid cleavage dioxygenase-like enzyme
MQVVQRNVFTLDEQLMIHDWGLTDNHYVLLANRVKLNSAGTYAARVIIWQTCNQYICNFHPLLASAHTMKVKYNIFLSPMYGLFHSSRADWSNQGSKV